MIKYIILVFLTSGVLCSQNAHSQECKVESINWSALESSIIDEVVKIKIKSAIEKFIADYNNYADLYDEEYEMSAERDFLKLIDGGNSSSRYLNDMLELPQSMQAYDYITLISEHFSTGYKFCLRDIEINSVKQQQPNLYALNFIGKKTTPGYFQNDQFIKMDREMLINYRMVVQGDDISDKLKATISELSFIDFVAPLLANSTDKGEDVNKDKDVAINQPKNLKGPKKDKSKTKKESAPIFLADGDNKPMRQMKIIYAGAGYGFVKNKFINGFNADVVKSKGTNYLIGFDYWKSQSKFNKLFYSIGVSANYYSITSTLQNNIALGNLGTRVQEDRAEKVSVLTFNTSAELTHSLLTVNVPIGIVYNLKKGNDPRTFMLQFTLVPGYSLYTSQQFSGKLKYDSYYGKVGSSDNCLINPFDKSESGMTLVKGFNLAAKLSPTYVYEKRSYQGKQGFGFIFGLDFTLGLMPLFKSSDNNIVEVANSTSQFIGLNKNASIFYNSTTYHSVGGRIGIYYVLN